MTHPIEKQALLRTFIAQQYIAALAQQAVELLFEGSNNAEDHDQAITLSNTKCKVNTQT
jgi:hypothetical protein